MISSLLKNAKNIPGWSTSKKILIIESDDWGSTRMPNKNTFDYLIKKEIRVDKNRFTTLDTLATSDDLDKLFDVLQSACDHKQNAAVISPFINVTNPDFQKIKASDYSVYSYEYFTTTQKKYFDDNVFNIWKKGIEKNIFKPQYHGREHYNVPFLMQCLQNKNKNLIHAFNKGVIHIPLKNLPNGLGKTLAPTYFYENKNQAIFLAKSLVDGINIFEKIFGFQPDSFGAPNGIFDPFMENKLAKTTIKGLVVNRNRMEPNGKGGLSKRSFLLKFGATNKHNQIYYRRNVKFEPIQKSYSRKEVLSNIDSAFRWGKPAILSSHRINFVGAIDTKHRDIALMELKNILSIVLAKHPELEFMSSSGLLNLMKTTTK